jgi:hypothetical protein
MKIPAMTWLPVALALLLAPRAAAQTPGQVLADFKKQAKVAVKDCKEALADAGAILQNDIENFELGFADLAGSDTPLETFVGKLIDYQAAAHLAVVQASNGIGDLAGAALAQLTPAGPDDDVHPKGLLTGDGGALDDVLAQLGKASAKASAGMAKKLDKLCKKLRAKTDMRLVIEIRAEPAFQIAPISGGFNGTTPSSLMIDLLVSFNRGGDDDDGRIWVSGFGESTAGDVSIVIHGPSADNGTAGPAVLDGRWSFGSAGSLKEGSYVVLAQQSGGAYVDLPIGLP